MAFQQTTLNELRYLLQTRYTGDAFWTVQDANDAINEALRYYNLFTGMWRGTVTTLTPLIPSPYITVPAALTSQTRVYQAGQVLTRKSLVGWYRTRRNWRTETISSGGLVPTTIREWAPVGLFRIAIWPADDVGGQVLTIDGVRVTPILTTDASFVDLSDDALNAVQDEALWILSFKRPSLQQEFQQYHQAFLAAVAEKNDRLRASSYFRKALGLDQSQRLRAHRASKTEETTYGGA